ncbi:MAG TPA: hypothetical protein GX404_05585 [Syntrophomonadaceae bacterium]|nr:hypothetical protein [Syntrophomonadaceae bacterium]
MLSYHLSSIFFSDNYAATSIPYTSYPRLLPEHSGKFWQPQSVLSPGAKAYLHYSYHVLAL